MLLEELDSGIRRASRYILEKTFLYSKPQFLHLWNEDKVLSVFQRCHVDLLSGLPSTLFTIATPSPPQHLPALPSTLARKCWYTLLFYNACIYFTMHISLSLYHLFYPLNSLYLFISLWDVNSIKEGIFVCFISYPQHLEHFLICSKFYINIYWIIFNLCEVLSKMPCICPVCNTH